MDEATEKSLAVRAQNLTDAQAAQDRLISDAEKIRRTVKEEIGITISIGVSFNKTFAKLGSDYKKPDAITYIGRENYKEILYPLPVEDMLFVGERTASLLRASGIRTIGDLAEASPAFLISRLGKVGEQLGAAAGRTEKTLTRLRDDEEEHRAGRCSA